MTLGRPSLEDRAYRGIPQSDPRMASGHNWHKLEDYQRCVYTIPKVSLEEPCKARMLQESSR